jgi:hypothetical protein
MRRIHWLMVVTISFILFILSLSFYNNSVYCMFTSIRAYGFPGQFVVLNKETDSLEEAQKVNSFTTQELLKRGWQIKFGASINLPISQFATFSVIANIFICVTISLVGVLLVNYHYKRKL